MTFRSVAPINSNIGVFSTSATGIWTLLPFRPEGFIFTNDGNYSIYVASTADNTTAVTYASNNFISNGSVIAAGQTMDFRGLDGKANIFSNPYVYMISPDGASRLWIKISRSV